MSSQQTGGLKPTRRTLVKGAAWSLPVVAVGGAAPAMANSPIPPDGLNGWVELQRDCWANYQYRIDGRGSYPNRGIWTFIDDPNADITFAQIIFWFNRDGWSFNNNQSGSGWSNLTRMNPQPGNVPAAGYVAYSATYTGSWTYYPGLGENGGWVADSDPYWREDDMPGLCGTVCAYADRTLTVNENTVSFRRGPVCV